MKKTLIVCAVLHTMFVLSLGGSDASGETTSSATLTMKNNSQFDVALYVSDEYKCTAEAEKFCTTQVSAGWNHRLSARVDGEEVTKQQYTFQEGEVRTWTVGFRPN